MKIEKGEIVKIKKGRENSAAELLARFVVAEVTADRALIVLLVPAAVMPIAPAERVSLSDIERA